MAETSLFTIPNVLSLFQEASEEIEQIQDDARLEEVRLAYLGRKNGKLTALMAQIGSTPPEERREFGKQVNILKKFITDALEKKKRVRQAEEPLLFDYSRPSLHPSVLGHEHLLTSTIAEIVRLFETLGFSIAEGPEIETTYYNFDGLNIPVHHPARDFRDNFYLDDTNLLRSQTSTVQIRTMEKEKPPLRIISPGRVYRPDAVDASHYFMFHQIEGLAVDEKVSFSDLKYVLHQFLRAFFGNDTKMRMRPHFFPFTEPSAEIDISCIICGGSGCSLCKHNGWLEILGCGMVDPNVLQNVKVNSEKYSAFAFGMGVERIAMLKHGIADIRLFFENDLRFLRQF